MAVTKSGSKKVQIVEKEIVATLEQSPKSPKEIAEAIRKSVPYVNLRLKKLIEDKRVRLLERIKIPAGCGFAYINVYTSDELTTAAHKLKVKMDGPKAKRDYLQIAFFGEPK